MLPQYSPEETQKILDRLPATLRSILVSQEFIETIERTADRYEVPSIPILSKIVGLVLMGLLNPEDFEKTVKTELKLKPDVAKKVNHEVRRFIFAPVKNELSELYQYEFTPVAKPVEAPRAPRGEGEAPTAPAPQPKRAPGEDTYREPIE